MSDNSNVEPFIPVTSEQEILEAMEQFGGGFVVAFSRCWRAADNRNRRLLLTGFRHLFVEYDEIAELQRHRAAREGA